METIYDDLWFCSDCTFYALTGDLPPETGDQRADIVREEAICLGVNGWGAHLTSDSDAESNGYREFSRCACSACGTYLGGSRHRFVVLG